MIALKNILVATDFGDAADTALTYARALASTFGASLHVLHVNDDI
jgi:nucleotide-binding universal stress UspA family protein